MSKTKRWKNCMSENLLMMLTVAGVLAGVAVGFALKWQDKAWTKREIMYIKFPGDLFLSMLKSLILPLIISSIVSAIGSLDLSLSGKIGRRSIYYYATTTICAVILGVILVTTIQPGVGGIPKEPKEDDKKPRITTTTDTILDLIRNIFPRNLVEACLAQYRTVLIEPDKASNSSNSSSVTTKYDWDISQEYAYGASNIVGLVVFGIVLGITIGKMGESGKPLLSFFESLSEAMIIITSWVIWLSPVGVTLLVASQILEVEDFSNLLGSIGKYFLTVLLGLFIHGFGTLSIIYFVCTRELPFKAISKMSQVMFTAFGTASSSATLPITLQCMDSMGVDPRISRFVVPIGATINMDGTALYEAVAAIYIAQLRGVEMSLGKIVGVSITATAASIGAAGIPQAGLVTMVMVLDTVGLPASDVTNIIAIDWLLDRFRTTVNVMCDALAAIIVEKMSKGELESADVAEGLQEATELVHLKKTDES